VALCITPVDEQTLDQWRLVHNEIIPTAPLSANEVRERAARYRLTLAYDDGSLVGNATLRPPDPAGTVTVIVRVLPGFRRRGYGSAYLGAVLSEARALGAATIRSVVLASNIDGLVFAQRRGFVEYGRHLLEGHKIPFVDLVLVEQPSSSASLHRGGEA
jgi:GNAT superfamily N-acetyltransferase